MVGRGAVGRPSIFRAIRENKDFLPKEESVIVLRHIDLVEKFAGAKGVKPMRGHLVQYTKGFDCAKSFRRDILSALSFDELRSVVVEYMDNNVEVVNG
jgi:tRNA-dihydrouridine synthase